MIEAKEKEYAHLMMQIRTDFIWDKEKTDEEGMIEIAKKLNGEENCKDYIENIEAFY